MEVKAFLIAFEKTLISDGFSPEDARSHTLKIARSLKDSDKGRIHGMEDAGAVKRMADNYAARINRLNEQRALDADNPDTVTIAKQFSESATDDSETDKTEAVENPSERDDDAVISPRGTAVITRKKDKVTKTAHATTQKIDVVTKIKKVKLTPRGKENYRKWMMTSGIGVALAVAFAAIGAVVVYALIALLISSLVIILVGIVAVGCVCTLAGLIYGIVKLFSVVPEGVYEIGLALIILGVTIASGIAIYNLAVRITPILWKTFSSYLKRKRIELREYTNKVRTECNGK